MSSGKIKIYIDGKEIITEKGRTILEVAKENGIIIPNLCNYPYLMPNGACRLCIVEVKGERRPIASCCFPVYDGMEIFTQTEKIRELRKLTLELIISDHPLDCMTCEKSGECLLEKYAYEYGIKKIEYEGEKSKRKEKDGSPFIIRDYEKCILCGRCVKVCEEIVGANAIDFGYRGFKTEIISGFDEPLKNSECVFCGNCIELCPVGALREISGEGKGRSWEYKKIKTVCGYCGVGCGINVYVKNNEIVKIKGDEESCVNKGFLCIKGKFGFEFVSSPDRLKKPLKRKNNDFEEITWEKAIGIICENIERVIKKYGNNSIAGLSSAKCTNEENYIFQKFFRKILKTNNIDHCARLCHSSTIAGLLRTIGTGAMTNSLEEIENYSDCIILTGTNVSETQPVTSYRIRKAVEKGAKLIIIDPMEISLSDIAYLKIQQNYGTDVLLFNSIAKIIIDEKLYDENFIKERVENFEEYLRFMENFSIEDAEKITGVSIEKLREVAHIYSKSKSSVIVWAMGITQHTTGTENVISLSNLALLCGQIGKKGAGLCPLRGQNNVQGACDMGALPTFYPGYFPVEKEDTIRYFKEKWQVDELPDKNGLTVVEIFENILSDRIKFLYIMGENPLVSDPDIKHVEEALKKIDFLVVQDIFLTETAKYADIILPSSCSFEKEGTFTNTERRVQKISKCIRPPQDVKDDWKIINELAEKLGYKWEYKDVWDILKEINDVVPQYKGITPERMKKGERIQWPCPSEQHPGTETLHITGFKTESGKGKLIPVEFKTAYELPDNHYPFILTTGRIREHYHSRTMTGRVKGINEIVGDDFCLINKEDAKRLKLKEGDLVRIYSRRGELKIKLKISDRIKKGVIFIPFHFYANFLTHNKLDPYSKIPEYKICACNIEKCME
jgi:formate dehydrogenase alpha subunit